MSVLPADMPQGHASGPAPHHFLLIGTGAVAGTGVRSHELSLVGCLARSITGRTGHGSDVELVISDRSTPKHLDGLLHQQRVSNLDGVVLVLEAGRHSRGAAAYGAELRTLLIALVERLPADSRVTVVAAPSSDDAHGASVRDTGRFSMFSEVIAAAVRPFAAFVALSPCVPGSVMDLYQSWADDIADALLPDLHDPLLWHGSEAPADEHSRQRAVTRLGALDAPWKAEFERFVTFARSAYGAKSASLSVIDGPDTRILIRQGIDGEVEIVPREDSICGTVLSTSGGIILADARLDTRFQQVPAVRSGAAAFYAGYRVESADGQPVAVLCVFDPEPRPVLSQDIAILRDLALAAQRRMWELDQTPQR